MSIEASLPMLLAIFGVSCSVFGVNTLVMGRLCRSKGIELSRQDIRQMRQGYVSVAVALVCLIVLVATSALSLIDARVGLALIAFELVGAGVGAFAAKRSVDDNWERIKEKQQAKRIEALSEELNGSGEQDMANVAEKMGIKMPDIDRKSMVDADIEAVKQNVIMGISCTKHPGEDAWEPTITAARLLEKAEKALLRDADAYFAQRAAQEALSLLKANERQIEQLHTLLEQEGSEDDR